MCGGGGGQQGVVVLTEALHGVGSFISCLFVLFKKKKKKIQCKRELKVIGWS